MLLPAIVSILPSMTRALAAQFISSGDVLQWVDLAVGIVTAGIAVPEKLEQLDREIAGFVDRGESPPPEWRERSDEAYGDIQSAARNAP
jgi:hypothetical protein